MPLAGLGLAAVLGLFVVVATLVALGRSNRHTLATLRSLGLDGRRRRACSRGEGLVIGGLVVVAGSILGVIGGTTLWRRITENFGVRPGVVVPWWLALGVVIVPAVAMAASVAATHSSRHEHLADVLRSE